MQKHKTKPCAYPGAIGMKTLNAYLPLEWIRALDMKYPALKHGDILAKLVDRDLNQPLPRPREQN